MTSRVSSHLLYCEPDRILRQMVVERDNQQTITAIFSLNDSLVESSHTSFFDGILSSAIVSLKKQMTVLELAEIRKSYNYVDFSVGNLIISAIEPKKMLIDFGTEETAEINRILQSHSDLPGFPLIDFITAAVYYPALILGFNAVLELNKQAELILWENTDLVGLRLKSDTHIHNI
ncbi:MAG: hypothetical protein WCG08_01115 [Paludibacter sp.]